MRKYKSLTPGITDAQLEHGSHIVSFLSFERAIKETNAYHGITKTVKGYYVDEQEITIIWNE
jgi:hypothetical protein